MRARGLEPHESDGWTLTMAHADEFFDLNGQDFVLDVVSELETPPAFPVNKSQFLHSRAEDYIHGLRSPQPVAPSRNTVQFPSYLQNEDTISIPRLPS